MKRLIAFLLVGATFLLPGCTNRSTPGGGHAASTAPSFTVKSAKFKTTLSCDASLVNARSSPWFSWSIQNSGDKPIHMLNHFAYLSRGPLLGLEFRREGYDPITVALNPEDTVNWGMQSDKILTLQPSETFKMKARAQFKDVSPGKYIVCARYRSATGFTMVKHSAEVHGIEPGEIWLGELDSNEIEITVEK